MSCVELHTGTLTKINTKGLTVEEYCEYFVRNMVMRLLMKEIHMLKP